MRSGRAPVERRLAAMLTLSLVVLSAISLATVATIRAFTTEAEWVTHTHVVIERLESLLAALGRSEGDQRGYLLTGDAEYLATAPADDAFVAATFAELKILTADNARQQRELERLRRAVGRRFARRDEVRETRRRAGLDAAVALVRSGRGRRLLQHVRAHAERMKRVEQRLLTVRSMRAERRATAACVAILVGTGLAFLVIAGIALWIRRDLRSGAHAERELRSVTERLNLALAAGGIGTWTWDVPTSRVVWDEFMHPLFGSDPTRFGGRYADVLAPVHPDDRALVDAAMRGALTAGVLDVEYRVRWPDGSTHVIATRGEVVRGPRGAPFAVAGVCCDVTAEHESRASLRRLKEAADAANEAKSEFLTSMSHELRTPMNSIIGFSQLVLRSKESRLAHADVDAMQTVQRNAKHLLVLINQVLDLARVEAGALHLVRTRLDLAALAVSVAAEARPLAAEKPISLSVERPDLPVIVEGDETRLRQIMTNLAANALKYTSAGAVTIRVFEREDGDVGPVACVSVTDTGPGIAEADRARLFQRFVRLDTAVTRREGGTGLGLSLAQQLAHMHGGRIDVASDGRSGSTFTLTIPLGWRRPRAADLAGAGAEAPMSALTVLCIDDDPSVLTSLQSALEDAGYRVLLASSCEEARAQAEAGDPDLLCLALQLPDGDALAFVRWMRTQPVLAAIPVVIVAGPEDEERALEGGARCVVVKPIDPDALTATVRQVLQGAVSTVLVVDDDADVRHLLRAGFERQGIGVVLAANGAEALRRLGEAACDVIVLDLAMPVMNGFDFLDALREVPAWRTLPVVILTGRDVDARDYARLAARCDAVLSKGRDDTVALVKAVTRRRHAAASAPSPEPAADSPV